MAFTGSEEGSTSLRCRTAGTPARACEAKWRGLNSLTLKQQPASSTSPRARSGQS